ncbi:MAG: phosphoserine phosphatase RsbU/P, partial [Candidatus Poribacteria bacterium]|nr:phosphoserine phosphatase RsbU/P [Candidatus Poribacteria bacterium]
MALKTRLKFRINTKILLTLLLLSLLPLVSFVLVFQFRMTSLNEYVERELIDKSKRDLQRLAKDQAAIADAILDKVMTQTYIIDHFASTLWDNRNPLSSRYRHSYSSYEKQPGDIYSASAYTLVPNVSFDMVRKDLDLSSNMDDIFMAIFDNHAELLFSIDAGFQNQLDSGTIQNGLRQKFIDNETTLSQNAAIEKIGNGWRINNGQKTYIIRKEENKINIYESAILDKAYIGTESGIFREYPWNSTMLFSIDVEFQNQLDSGIIPEELRRKFIDNEIALSQNATIGKVGNGWQINDGQKTYIIRKEENEINTYDNSFYPRNRPWYRKAVREGKIVWTKYRDWDKNKYIFTCSSPVFKSNNILVGVVGVDITLETISQRIINTPEEVPGYAFLVNEDGTIIAKEDGLTVENDGFIVRDDVDIQKKEEEEIIITPAKESGIIKQMMNRDKDGGIDFDELNYIAYAPIPSGKLSVGIVMPFDSITELAHQTETRIEKVQYILITILIIMIFVVIGMAYRQAKKITKPILALNQGAKIVGGGNLDYLLDVKTGDEIEDLANTFNKMTDNLKIYVKDLKETTAAKERIESELKIATQIQASMLPRIFPAFPDKKEFNIFATMEPAKEVGGDFYDFFLINENKLCFLVG